MFGVGGVVLDVAEGCSGIYKSPLFPHPDSIDEILTKNRKIIIAVYNQFTQQIFLNMALIQIKRKVD